MRNLIFFSILLVTITSCKQSSGQLPEALNINAFEKHQVDGVWQYTDHQGNNVQVQKDADEYWETITGKETLFTQRNDYYANGQLKVSGQYFRGDGFAKGVWIYYDQNGRIIKTEDKDIAFKKHPWEAVLSYLKKNRVNLLDKLTRVNNHSGPNGTYWLLSWKTGKTTSEGLDMIKNVWIDVNSGKIIIQKDTYCCID